MMKKSGNEQNIDSETMAGFKSELIKESKSKFRYKKKGKMKADCMIYASEKILETIDDSSIKQCIDVASLPGIVGNSIAMPDMHKGYGFPIGGVAAFDSEEGIITPGGIGFDINCGVRLLRSDLVFKEDERYEESEALREKINLLIQKIYENVPCGIGEKSDIILSEEELDSCLDNGIEWAVTKGFAQKEDLLLCEENGRMKEADSSFVSKRAKARGRNQLGTLGAGNHFIEIQKVEDVFDKKAAEAFGLSKGRICILIHCGSRGLGHQVCSDFLRRMEDENREIYDSLPEKDLIYAPINSRLAKDYFKAMCASANFAWANRQIIHHKIKQSFEKEFPENKISLVYDVAHNIAKKEEHYVDGANTDGAKKTLIVHRKGATRCFPSGRKENPAQYSEVGHPAIIPGSMGTSSYVMVGTETALNETFGSAAHGAGRVLSRAKAKKKYSGEQIKKDLASKKIFLKARFLKGVSDEAPGAYKEIDEVIKSMSDSDIAKPVVRLVPLAVIKG